jgi:hypothetical protein
MVGAYRLLCERICRLPEIRRDTASARRLNGDGDRTRTCNLLLRRQLLYPVELHHHEGKVGHY